MPNYNSTLQTNNSSLEEIITQLNNLPDAPETVAQATPAITVNQTTGLITATATQIAGYVPAGTKSATHQLTFQPAQTITPGTTDKTIAANTYLGGVQTIKGDANLVASNIVSGKSIFGVVGTASVGGGGDTSVEDELIGRILKSCTNDRVTSIGSYAFAYCRQLTTVSFPACKTIGRSAFISCSALTTASFPVCSSIAAFAFMHCSGLTAISFPACMVVGPNAFTSCQQLTTVSLSAKGASGQNVIDSNAFANCYNLTALYLTGSLCFALHHSDAFTSTPIGGYSGSAKTYGSIYVPTSLLTAYQTATNWAYFSSRFVGI